MPAGIGRRKEQGDAPDGSIPLCWYGDDGSMYMTGIFIVVDGHPMIAATDGIA